MTLVKVYLLNRASLLSKYSAIHHLSIHFAQLSAAMYIYFAHLRNTRAEIVFFLLMFIDILLKCN